MKDEQAFVIAIEPGRFDKLYHDVQKARMDVASISDIAFGTESVNKPFRVMGWHETQGKGAQGENFVATGPRFTLIAEGIQQITSGHGTGRFANPTYVCWQIVHDSVTGLYLLLISDHLRAHLWPGSDHYQKGNVAAWIEGVRSIRALKKRLKRRYKQINAIIVAGDPNAVHRAWFAAQIKRFFKNFTIAWGGAFSTAWIKGLKITDQKELKFEDASDHPWVLITLKRIEKKKGKR